MDARTGVSPASSLLSFPAAGSSHFTGNTMFFDGITIAFLVVICTNRQFKK